jgi:hypothetical protein
MEKRRNEGGHQTSPTGPGLGSCGPKLLPRDISFPNIHMYGVYNYPFQSSVTNDPRNNIWTLFLTANNNIHGLGEN